ncbi:MULTISPECIES: IclR family transcriptional regulator [unclassified Isoptericola]|uniref:IclR family transcriptional regulator n=1 Tax=unclassified Isoptericola TaxID=2623355 RepID=UPI0036490769
MTATGPAPEGVKSSERTLDVLELLARAQVPMTFTQILQALGVPKSSLHKLLGTLERRGWVETDDLTHSRYRVGLRALQAGTSYVDADEIVHLTEPVLTTLTDRFGEASHLGRLDGSDVVYLAKRESTHPLRMFSAVGRRLPAHATAMGKAILATYTWDEVVRVVGDDLDRLTPSTITSLSALRDELDRTRERGYGVDDEESADLMRAVAVALPGSDAHNAVSVSAPVVRMPQERMPDVANAISEALTQIWPRAVRRSV